MEGTLLRPGVQEAAKVAFGNDTLVDLTRDTVSEAKLLAGFTAHDSQGFIITGTCTYDSDTSNASATVYEVLQGKTAYAKGVKITGEMPNIGQHLEEIYTKTQQITIPRGYHDGTGKIEIEYEVVKDLVPENIAEGITILGVTGTKKGVEDCVATSASAKPTIAAQTIRPPQGYTHLTSVYIEGIPYSESENFETGAITVKIG